MLSFVRNHKVISIVIAVNLVAVMVLVIAFIIHNSKTATIDILVAPENATIEINGKAYENYQSYNLAPGDYTAVISMEYMQIREISFTLNDDDFYRLNTYLLSQDGSFEYYEYNHEDEQLLEKIATKDDKEAQAFIEHYKQLYNITEVLPLEYSVRAEDNNGEVVSISVHQYDGACFDIVCLEISDYTGKNHDMAIQMIKDAGYNPDDYTVTYKSTLGEGE